MGPLSGLRIDEDVQGWKPFMPALVHSTDLRLLNLSLG